MKERRGKLEVWGDDFWHVLDCQAAGFMRVHVLLRKGAVYTLTVSYVDQGELIKTDVT